jgi:hypothetical protein
MSLARRKSNRRHAAQPTHRVPDLIERLEPRILLAAVSVFASDPVASETNPNLSGRGQLAFSRTGPLTDPLTINYSVAGTATSGADYNALAGTITLIPGQRSARIFVTPIADSLAEANETVIAVITPDAAYDIGARSSATVTIRDNAPTVSVVASKPRASEINAGAASSLGRFTFTRTGPLTNPLTVDYTVTGTATDGTDFAALAGSVTFLAGKASAVLNITPLVDGDAEGTESVILTLDPGGTPAFKTSARNSATVTITDAQPVVSIVQVRNLSESGANGAFRITRTGGDLSTPLAVDFTVAGTATSGVDFTALAPGVTIAAGQRSVLVPVSAIADLDSEGSETVIVSVTPDPAFSLDPIVARQSATLTIADVPPLNFLSDTSFNVDGASFTYLAVSPDNSVSTAQITVEDAGILGQKVTLVSNGPGGFSDVRTFNFVDDGVNVSLTSRELLIPDITPTTIGGVTTGFNAAVTGIGNSLGNVPAVITSPQLILVPSLLEGGTATDTAPATMVFGATGAGLAQGTVAASTRLNGTATVASPLGTFTANRVDIVLTTAMTTLINGGTTGISTGTLGMTERYTFYLVPGIGIVRAIVNISQTTATPGNVPVTATMSYTASLFSYAV